MNNLSTFSQTHKNYNVIGRGPDNSRSRALPSVLQLIRGRKYQLVEDIRRIASQDFFDVIVTLQRGNTLPYERLVAEYPNLRFMLYDSKYYNSIGAIINDAITEVISPVVMIVWNGVDIFFQSETLRNIRTEILCHLPIITDSQKTTIPTFFVPTPVRTGHREHFVEPQAILPNALENCSLFPYDYCGIYVKERFNRCGGFDAEITNPYWQKLEFGYRAWLWGERLEHLSGFSLSYSEEPTIEEGTPDEDYLRFYLRTISVVYNADHATLPLSQFWPYLWAGNKDILRAWACFIRERHWVKDHAYNYQIDFPQLVELWGEDL